MTTNLAGSPVIDPARNLEEMLAACTGVGLTKFEIMTGWTGSAFDIEHGAQHYLDIAARHGVRFTSLHLPPATLETLPTAVRWAEFAQALGVAVVIFKAATREDYIATLPHFLDRVDGFGLTTVITNHANSCIATPDDYRAVLDGVNDSRLLGLLEVGHFYAAGFTWQDGYDLLKGRIGLVHIKDMRDGRPVPYGEGEVDFAGLFQRLTTDGYTGNYVIELEKIPSEQALALFGAAVEHIQRIQREISAE